MIVFIGLLVAALIFMVIILIKKPNNYIDEALEFKKPKNKKIPKFRSHHNRCVYPYELFNKIYEPGPITLKTYTLKYNTDFVYTWRYNELGEMSFKFIFYYKGKIIQKEEWLELINKE